MEHVKIKSDVEHVKIKSDVEHNKIKSWSGVVSIFHPNISLLYEKEPGHNPTNALTLQISLL